MSHGRLKGSWDNISAVSNAYMLAGIKMSGSSISIAFLLLDNQAAGSTPSKGSPAATRPKGSVIDLTEDDDDVQGKLKLNIYFTVRFQTLSRTM